MNGIISDLLCQSFEGLDQFDHGIAAVLIAFVRNIDVTLVIGCRKNVEYNVFLRHTADVFDQGIADQGGGDALFHVCIQTCQSVQLKKDSGGEVGLLKNGICLFADVIVSVHQNKRGLVEFLQRNGIALDSMLIL